jgi:hypothetical protein
MVREAPPLNNPRHLQCGQCGCKKHALNMCHTCFLLPSVETRQHKCMCCTSADVDARPPHSVPSSSGSGGVRGTPSQCRSPGKLLLRHFLLSHDTHKYLLFYATAGAVDASLCPLNPADTPESTSGELLISTQTLCESSETNAFPTFQHHFTPACGAKRPRDNNTQERRNLKHMFEAARARYDPERPLFALDDGEAGRVDGTLLQQRLQAGPPSPTPAPQPRARPILRQTVLTFRHGTTVPEE